jgi:hypothetical protein
MTRRIEDYGKIGAAAIAGIAVLFMCFSSMTMDGGFEARSDRDAWMTAVASCSPVPQIERSNWRRLVVLFIASLARSPP